MTRSDRERVLVADPALPWDNGAEPYGLLDALSKAAGGKGISPAASTRVVNDLSFDLMGRRLDGEARAAWDSLRLPQRRLLVDFLHYGLPAVDDAQWWQAVAALPMPVELPDFRQAARAGVDPGELPPPPAHFPQQVPDPCPVAMPLPPPLDLCPEEFAVEQVLEETHE